MQTKMQTNGGPCSPSLAIAGFVRGVYRVRVPLLAPDKPIENLEESRISMGSAELLDML